MTLSKLCIANLGRAVVVAFGAQVVAAAMCLMPAGAMAAVPSAAVGGMTMHDDACVMHHGTPQSHVKHACPHCDAPDQAVSQIDIGHGLQAPTPVLVAPSMPRQIVAARGESPVPVERILAPPGSTSLIYSTNRRIRI